MLSMSVSFSIAVADCKVRTSVKTSETHFTLFKSVMVRENLGYALGFDGLVNTGTDSDLCFRPLEPALLSPMYIIWKKYQVFSPVASLLLDELKKCFESI